MQTGAVVGLLALVVVFQPELRRALERIGRFGSFGWVTHWKRGRERGTRGAHPGADGGGARGDADRALVVVERGLMEDVAETGVLLHADLTDELLASIFTPHGALHDGAVIVRGDRILAAAAVLPLSEAAGSRSDSAPATARRWASRSRPM